jgi:DNA-binding transcriptional LysR family regulator
LNTTSLLATDLDSTRIDELAALLAIAREGSFVAAGRSLLRHPTIVSRRIAALEARLGVRLIERTTRQVKLTAAGERLAEQVRSASEAIVEAEHEASADAAELRGRLKLAFPSALGRQWLAPLLPDFMKRHPALQIEVDYSERYIDLVAEGFDAAVRVGILNDSRLVAKKLCGHRRVLGASPDYLKRFGEPREPRDLAEHNCICLPSFASFPNWKLKRGSREETILAQGSLLSNDSLALLEAARQGIGILGGGEWLMARDFAQGVLVPVLPGWTFDANGGVYLVRPSIRHAPARVQAFAVWITGQFSENAPWLRATHYKRQKN